jgi:hypothetical protein
MLIPERGWLQNCQRLVTGGPFLAMFTVEKVKKSVIFSCFFMIKPQFFHQVSAKLVKRLSQTTFRYTSQNASYASLQSPVFGAYHCSIVVISRIRHRHHEEVSVERQSLADL